MVGDCLLPVHTVRDVALTARAIITGKDSSYNTVSDLRSTTFGISRLGSGSQVMASVLAMQEGWTGTDLPTFKGTSRYFSSDSSATLIARSQWPVQAVAGRGKCWGKYIYNTARLMISICIPMGMVHHQALCRFWRSTIYRLGIQFVAVIEREAQAH
jgi:hypothetical protein